MTHRPPGWPHHPRPIVTPPPEANGWGRYVAATLAHILARLHYLERSHDEMRSRHISSPPASAAPTTSQPSAKEIWAERKETAREVATAMRWLAALVMSGLVATKWLSLEDLRILGRPFGFGG